ncbi:restriction endonuclease subunit S [Niallia nealsonii]|uniref:Restriction endonuclease subunit S n=1 Tax=Niallia nealsonii TaxID=115979 RepID=A0A2N0Z458_9BACI|nr:restriction endonuclease subunit S [Niallia nealsonii]PKG24286.1 restriction endonuclease subunit S [Niallia nealsonii]
MSWKVITLGDLVVDSKIDLQTGPFGTQLKASDYTEEGTPVINVRNIGYGSLRKDRLEFVPDHVVNRLKKHILQRNDIVFGRKGAVDRHLIVTENEYGWMQGSDCIRLRFLTDEINPQYFSYFIMTENHKQWMINQCSNKATMASLNQDVIKRISFQLPDLPTQEKIVDLLSKYDDLIENNTKRITLLDNAARLLYKEWFVHLRFPGNENTQFINELPGGWRNLHLSELVTTQYGFTETAQTDPVGPKFLRGTDINKVNYIDWSSVPYCKINSTDYDKYKLDIGDIVVIRMADPGKVGIVEKEIPSVFASYLVRMKIKDKELMSSYYLFYTLLDSAYQGFVTGVSTGSTRKSASAKLLVDFNLNVPPRSLLNLFDEYIIPLRKEISTLLDQNKALYKAQSLLLPRLMKGEISV